MYAIFEDGGKQYKVSTGDKPLIELKNCPRIKHRWCSTRSDDAGEGRAHRHALAGRRVAATVIEETKLPKVTGVKFRRRKGYLKKWGHRQRALLVRIDAINA